MKVTIYGAESISYQKKDGTAVTGVKLFYLRDPNSREVNVTGNVSGDVFINSSSDELFKTACSVVLGSDYDLIYDSDGRYSFLSDIVAV